MPVSKDVIKIVNERICLSVKAVPNDGTVSTWVFICPFCDYSIAEETYTDIIEAGLKHLTKEHWNRIPMEE